MTKVQFENKINGMVSMLPKMDLVIGGFENANGEKVMVMMTKTELVIGRMDGTVRKSAFNPKKPFDNYELKFFKKAFKF